MTANIATADWFWSFVDGDLAVREFEKWLYADPKAEHLFAREMYDTLLLLDYRHPDVVAQARREIESWLCSKFPSRSPIQVLFAHSRPGYIDTCQDLEKWPPEPHYPMLLDREYDVLEVSLPLGRTAHDEQFLRLRVVDETDDVGLISGYLARTVRVEDRVFGAVPTSAIVASAPPGFVRRVGTDGSVDLVTDEVYNYKGCDSFWMDYRDDVPDARRVVRDVLRRIATRDYLRWRGWSHWDRAERLNLK